MDNNQEDSPQSLTKKERRQVRREERDREISSFHRNRLANRIILWALLGLVLGGSVFLLVRFGGKSNSNLSVNTVLAADDWVFGNIDAKVTLIEYSDFQCPACASYYPIVKQLTEEFKDEMRFAYRHFPLKSIHPNAVIAGVASEAAGRQGKFWEMTDLLFINQNEWANSRNPKEIFEKYASSIKLDVDKFKQNLDLKELEEKLNKSYQDALAGGLSSTPTFFLNGKKIQPKSYDEFKKLLETSSAENQ